MLTAMQGTWGFLPRLFATEPRFKPKPHTEAWPALSNDQLPSPFSCMWSSWDPADDWVLPGSETRIESDSQEELRRCWGVAGLTPVMFMAHARNDCAFFIPTVLRAGETYYLWRYEGDPYFPWLRRFEGTYTSVEDFIANADWNALSDKLEELDGWYEKWMAEGEDEDGMDEDGSAHEEENTGGMGTTGDGLKHISVF